MEETSHAPQKRRSSVVNSSRASKRSTAHHFSDSASPTPRVPQSSESSHHYLITDQVTTTNNTPNSKALSAVTASTTAAAVTTRRGRKESLASEKKSASSSRFTSPPSTSNTQPALTENDDTQTIQLGKKRRPYKPRGPYRTRLRRPHERTELILQHMLRSRVSTLPVLADVLNTKASDRCELDCMRHYPYNYPYLHQDFPYDEPTLQSKRVRKREAAVKLMDDIWYIPQGPVAPEDLFTKKKLEYTLSILEATTMTHTALDNKLDDAEYYGRGFALAARKVLDKMRKEEIDKLLKVSDDAVERLYGGEGQPDELGITPPLREAIAEMTKSKGLASDHTDITAIVANLPAEALPTSLERDPLTVSLQEGDINDTESNISTSPEPEKDSDISSSYTPKVTSTATALLPPPPPVLPIDTTHDIAARAFGSVSKIGDIFYNLVEAADDTSRDAIQQAIGDNSLGQQHLKEATALAPVDMADYYQANLFLSAVFSSAAEQSLEPIRLSHGACRIIQTLLSGLDHKLVTMGCHLQRAELTRLLANANNDIIHPRKKSNRGRRKKVRDDKPTATKTRGDQTVGARQLAMNPLNLRLGLDPFAKARKYVLEQVGDWTEAQRRVQTQEYQDLLALEEERNALLAYEMNQISQILIRKKRGDAVVHEDAVANGADT
ncbi:hypothetical protein BGZ73_006456 [Actinomortierella ambigua]|nr:hypothetical protein BGZ73_006456 [Actinomortierella ambigua]